MKTVKQKAARIAKTLLAYPLILFLITAGLIFEKLVHAPFWLIQIINKESRCKANIEKP